MTQVLNKSGGTVMYVIENMCSYSCIVYQTFCGICECVRVQSCSGCHVQDVMYRVYSIVQL